MIFIAWKGIFIFFVFLSQRKIINKHLKIFFDGFLFIKNFNEKNRIKNIKFIFAILGKVIKNFSLLKSRTKLEMDQSN